MALGVYKLTHHQRYLLAIVTCVLNGIQMLIGLGITVNSIYVYLEVAPGLHSERAEISFVFLVMAIFGTHVILVYLAGMKICERCYLRAIKRTTKHLYVIWTIISVNTIINLMVISTMFVRISKHIIRSMKHSLEKGMRKYLSDEVWKRTIDGMQYRMQCCGIDSYEDWHTTAWLNKYNVNPDHDTIKSLRLSKDFLHLPVVPWSCCKLDFPMQCFHDPLQQLESAHIWTDEPDLIKSSFHEDGCLEVLRRPVQSSLSVYIVLVAFIVVLHLAIMVLTKYLFSACRNAAILMNTGGTAPGWLFGRGDCGYTRGKGLYEIMETTERSNVESPGMEDNQTSMREENITERSEENQTERSEENPVCVSHERDLLLR